MSHPKPTEMIEWVAGRIAGADAERLESHLRGCADCAGYAASIRDVWQALGELPEETLRDDLLPRIERLLDRPQLATTPPWSTTARLRIAAAILLAVGIGHLAGRQVGIANEPTIDPQQAAESVYLDLSPARSGSLLAELLMDGPDQATIGGNG